MIKSSTASGWFLLVFGMGIILWTLYSSFNVFTGKTPVPEIFKIEKKVEIPLPAQAPKTPQAQMEKIFQEQIQEQMKGMLPSDVLPRLLNLISWSIFAGIMIFGGSQVASLGIKLIK